MVEKAKEEGVEAEEALELETLEVETQLVEAEVKVEPKRVLSPEQIASFQRAHEIKVAKFLAGGK